MNVGGHQVLKRLQLSVAAAPVPWLVLACCLVLLLAAAPPLVRRGILWNERQAYEGLADQGRDRLTLYGVALHSELEQSRNIPQVLSSDPDVVGFFDLLAQGKDPGDRSIALDRRLAEMDALLEVAAVYLLDPRGICVAASNWDQGAGSFVGQHLGFRPYFLTAMKGGVGHYFAVGTTINEPGYYVAMPVQSGGRMVGAVAVKTSMDNVEHGWSGGGERVFVTDRHGVIFITNTPQWRFRTLAPLDGETREDFKRSRQYGDEPLLPLSLMRRGMLTLVDGTRYVAVSQALPYGDGWTLHVLLDVKEAEGRARDRALLAGTILAITLLFLYFTVQRGLMLQRHTRELEQRVAERTAALLDSNERLQGEIVERQRAEEELKNKQDELIQAAKLAALGQMSAGMAHEINQPLAAIRSYADNAVTLLGLGRAESVRGNLEEIAGLTERMARLTGQLKQFARKSSGRAEAVPVAATVESALALMVGRLSAEKIVLEWQPPPLGLTMWGDEVRLQQVLINLFRNALDAMRCVSSRCLAVEVSSDETTVSISVHDSGPGINSETMGQLFDPFFTTKPAGEGLGLGLSISERIVRSFGGHLVAANHPAGGAVFTVTLPRRGRQ